MGQLDHPCAGLTRRDFLRNAALAGGALMLPAGGLISCKSYKRTGETPHYFIFYFLIGGWDLVLTTEPFPRGTAGIHVPYKTSEIVEVGAHRYGPAMRHLVPYMDRMAVLRGLYMRALNHPQARFRLVTGAFKGKDQMPVRSVQTLLAHRYEGRYDIPNLSGNAMRPQVWRGEMPLAYQPLRVASVDQLRSLARVDGDTVKYQAEIAAAIEARDRMMKGRYPNHELVDEFAAFADLARHAGAGAYPERLDIAAEDQTTVTKGRHRTDRQAQLAVEAVRQDLAPCITVGSGEFDSHTRTQYRGHPNSVDRAMKTVATIVKGLLDSPGPAGGTMLDHTTVVVSSEFSREPHINEIGGKHHWTTNSALLFGKGVKRSKPGQGPVVFGKVDKNLRAVPLNPENGGTEKGAVNLEITYALSTVLAMAGIDPIPHFGVPPITDVMA